MIVMYILAEKNFEERKKSEVIVRTKLNLKRLESQKDLIYLLFPVTYKKIKEKTHQLQNIHVILLFM